MKAFSVIVWHGEGKSLFYVRQKGRGIVATFTRRTHADNYIVRRMTTS